MSRERVIVSIGEAFLSERGEHAEAGGLAVAYAAAAARIGTSTGNSSGGGGWMVSRIGQDQAGEELLRLAQASGVIVEHVQSDPDLPTARLITRAIAGRVNSNLSANAAFDNLQWDFDMVDLAQRADAVVFGQLARRGGQTKSVIRQFLFECSSGGGALRVFDLTNRSGEKIDRGDLTSALEFCDVLVSDDIGLRGLAPASGGQGDDAMHAAAFEVLRISGVQVVVMAKRTGEQQRLRAVSRDQTAEANEPIAITQHEEAIVRWIHALIDGIDLATCLRRATACIS